MKARIVIEYYIQTDKTMIGCLVRLKNGDFFLAQDEYNRHPTEFIPEHARKMFGKMKHEIETSNYNNELFEDLKHLGLQYEWIIDL